MRKTRILGTGHAVPTKVLGNQDLEKLVDTSDAWIMERTGIRERRILEDGRQNSDLATDAARSAIQAAGLAPTDIDCIILATVTPDMYMPAAATIVQRKLGIGTCPAFDLSAACAGFLYGMSIGDAFVKAGSYKRVLVIGVEILSRVTDWKDRGTCILFGDGAGAVVLGPQEQPGQGPEILSTNLFADGSGTPHLQIPAGGSAMVASESTVAQGLHVIKMNGKAVFTHAVKGISGACMKALDDAGIAAADVDMVVAHQANLRILEAVSQRTGIPMEKFFVNIHKFGNTSSASVPIALDEVVRAGGLKPGMRVLFTAFGGGFTWGAAAVRW